MHLAHLRLRDFRNYARLDSEFTPGFHVLMGDNAQGKTNILEALYLVSTLRSFRGAASAQMVRHGQKGYFVGARVHSSTIQRIKLYWSPHERRLSVDDQPVQKLADYLGTLRTVVFCTEDLQLVKGTGRIRRRFMDLLLCQTHPKYLALLQNYTRAVRSRNTLLKARPIDELALEGFTSAMVQYGRQIIEQRSTLVPRISPLANLACRRITRDQEDLRLEYHPSVLTDLAVELAKNKGRERTLRTTVIGPHRDDLRVLINDNSAAIYGSEGQKRSIAIALKMAQAEYLTELHGAPPILLIDDVMGELDAHRRAGLLPLLERAHQAQGQVFMTCTEENWPRELGRRLQYWTVRQGGLSFQNTVEGPL